MALFVGIAFAIPVFFVKTKPSEESDENPLSKLGYSFSKVYGNWLVLFVFLGDVCDSILIAGTGAFGLKFLMQNYWLSTTEAGLYSGLCAAAGSFVGLIFNGLVLKFAKLSTKQILIFSIVQSLITTLLFIPQWSLVWVSWIISNVFVPLWKN